MTARTLSPFDAVAVAPWRLGSGRRGCLLLHGFAGTPPELRRLGEHLAANGWRCHAPALPGHATTPEELERTTWRDWETGARSALEELLSTCEVVVVAGQSMGGTMALRLAASDLRVAAVATLAAPLWVRHPLIPLLPLLMHVVRWQQPGSDIDLFQPDAITELYSYGRRPTRSVHQFVRLLRATRDQLAMVRAPVLVLHGGRDRTIDPRNSNEIVSRLLCSAAVERHMYPRSGHGLSVDVDREDVNARVLEWFSRHTTSCATGVPGPG